MARRVGVETERSSFWRGHVEGWRRSGESVRGYCRRHGLSEAGFYAWRRELRLRDGLQTLDSLDERAAFVEVKAVPAPVASAELELVLGAPAHGERVVRIPVGFDADTLSRVIAVVEGVGC